MIKILNIVGARPNFMKVAPLHRCFSKSDKIVSKILHTGQHYDERMSDIFFNQLELPKPDYYLGIGGGSHSWTTANIMLKFEEVIKSERPDVVLVVGDVNSTLACTLVAVKEDIPVVHVEAGLRSGDRSMPEEINRILTDSISSNLFVTEQSGMINLAKEGFDDSKIHFVGHVMIDSLIHYRGKASKSGVVEQLGLSPKKYILMTMHRPQNVDNVRGLESIIEIIKHTTQTTKVVFPIHPRTKKQFVSLGLFEKLSSIDGLILLPPQGYLEFLSLMDQSFLVITDSGGIQEETTYLKVPCITFRSTTERPVTIDLGTNILVENLESSIVNSLFDTIHLGSPKESIIPPLWDGKASERIRDILIESYYQ